MAGALKSNSVLTSLNLDNNSLDELTVGWKSFWNSGGEALAEALALNSTLTSLNLARNSLEERSGVALAGALVSNTTLTSLNRFFVIGGR